MHNSKIETLHSASFLLFPKNTKPNSCKKDSAFDFLCMIYCDTEIRLLYHETVGLFNGERRRLQTGLNLYLSSLLNAFLKTKALFQIEIDTSLYLMAILLTAVLLAVVLYRRKH